MKTTRTPELVFDLSIAKMLHVAFLKAAKEAQPRSVSGSLSDRAELFIGQLESVARRIVTIAAAVPPNQKKRVQLLQSISNQAYRMLTALSALDDDAAAWLFANKIGQDDESHDALPLAPDRARIGAPLFMHRNQGELLAIMRAADRAASTLPPYDFKRRDPRYEAAQRLQQIFERHGIEALFVPSKGSLAYLSLAEVFALAQLDSAEPTYWIRKVGNQPDTRSQLQT